MKRSKFNEEQIIAILWEQKACGQRPLRSAGDTGSAAPRFIRGRAGMGGMEISDVKRLKALEDENANLRRHVHRKATC